jgi:penicillin amidase
MKIVAGAVAGVSLAGCALLTPLPKPTSVSERLAAMPATGLPLDRPVTIHWNDYQVPFIEAGTDDDLAFALGLVHAHLRLGQMEVARRITQGRLAEMGGPLATDIDHSLRILDYRRGARATIAALPPDTRRWLVRYVAGINHYLDDVETLPHEFALLGLEREPWTVEDSLAIGRLASTDINWLVWFEALKLRDRPDWPAIWREAVTKGMRSVPSFGPEAVTQQAAFAELLAGFGESGSNSVAVAGSRTDSGAALIANDPHLGVSLPNLWLVAGYKSPSYHAVGMMIPGVPFVAVGRNPWIAWGGTNMRAASSDLVDVSGLPVGAISERRETIGVRYWFDRDVTLRDSPFGPVISDAPVLGLAEDGPTLALRWMGHRGSDEVTAMLGVSRARDWRQFRQALDGFAVPGQNMIYADAEGHIGQLMAVHLPRRPAAAPDDVIVPAGGRDYWSSFASADDLPSAFDPPSGYVASANNRPAEADIAIGWFFSNDDRIVRLHELLSGGGTVSLDDLRALQRDVFLHSAVVLRDALLKRLGTHPLTGDQRRVRGLLAGWDGRYDVDSAGALAFELTMYHFTRAYFDDARRDVLAIGQRFDDYVAEALAGDGSARLVDLLAAALGAAAGGVDAFDTWGAMHRIALAHPLRALPLIGDRYRFGEAATPGTTTTLFKTAHADTDERHDTRYGAQSRHISDLSDPDANWFVLLGGQDGWFNSASFADQFALWQRGDYMKIPLRPETARAEFAHHMTLTP